MRKNGGGKIVCLSSLAGVWPLPFQVYYCASKAAIRAYTFALHNEIKEFGIGVCAVMPGDTNTQPVRYRFHAGDDIYGGKIAKSVASMEKEETNGVSPDKVGRWISAVALKKRTRPYYSLGWLYKLGLFANRLLPYLFVRWVLGLAYVKK
jgi:short-subunit dehydrogenase